MYALVSHSVDDLSYICNKQVKNIPPICKLIKSIENWNPQKFGRTSSCIRMIRTLRGYDSKYMTLKHFFQRLNPIDS